MNSDDFFRYIEKTRDCDPQQLDLALMKGIRRAKNDRALGAALRVPGPAPQVQPKKIFLLAAASVFAFAACIIVNLAPVKLAVDRYYINWHSKMPDSSQILNGYVIDMASSLKKHLGGE